MATYTYTARMATNLAINTIIELVLTQGTQSVADNRTPFTYTIKIRRVNNWNDNFTGNADVTFTMGGTSVVSITSKWWSIYGDTITKEYTLASGSFNVYHDSDGKKTAAIYVRVDPNVSGFNWGTAEVMTINKSLTLPTIPRATTITSVGNITTASTGIAVNISRKSTSFTHSMNLYIGSTFIAEWTGSTANFTGSKTLALDTTHRTRMLNAIPTSTSATGKFTVRTFSGSTTIGYASKNITISVDGEQVPRLSAANFSTVAETRYNLSGVTKSILAQHAGTLSYSAPWVMATGASVKSRSTTFGGATRTTSAGVFSTSASATSQNIVTKVTDSRGRTNSLTRAITVVPYSLVKLEVAYVGRPRDTNTAKHYLEVELYLTVHDFNSENKYRVRIQTKETGTSTWDTAHTVNYSGGTSRVKRVYVPSQIYEETKSYDVRIILEDELSSATSTGVLGTANYTLVLGKTNIGVNMIPGSGKGLHVNGSIWDTNNGVRNLSDTVSNLLTSKPAWSEITGKPANSQFPNTAEAIGASKNLNNYTTPGFYYQSMNANASTSSNYPVALAGTLIVTKDAGTTQMYYAYNGAGVYYRIYYNTSWTAWKNLLTPAWSSVTGKPAIPAATAGTKSTTGYVRFDNGIKINWSTVTINANVRRKTFTWASAFSSVYAYWTAGSYYDVQQVISPVTTTGGTLEAAMTTNSGLVPVTATYKVFAIGV